MAVGRTWRSTAGLHVEILQGSQTISGEAFKKPILGLISLLLYSFEKNRTDSDRVSKILFVSKVVGCFWYLLQSNVSRCGDHKRFVYGVPVYRMTHSLRRFVRAIAVIARFVSARSSLSYVDLFSSIFFNSSFQVGILSYCDFLCIP